jgi:hypothetical protein
MVPFQPENPPQDDHLEHYLSMRLSKCYRGSGGQLACIRCHDPHVQPSEQQRSAYFREKCLACHTEKSCTAELTDRQRTNPPDDCVRCHMPKRDLKLISHSALTNHRIVAKPDEPFPDAAFHMTTPELPDLVDLSAAPGKQTAPSSLTLLEVYSQVMLSNPAYRARYWTLAKQLEVTDPDNVLVLEGMADVSLQQKNWQGVAAAICYLDRARTRGAKKPADFEELARLLVVSGRKAEALDLLRQGIDLIPYDPELYRLLGRTYLSLNKRPEACTVLARAVRIFPQDADMQSLSKECAQAEPKSAQ